MNLYEVAEELGNRLVSTFTRDENGHRPVFGGTAIFQDDPTWSDNLLFYEYFHGDNGAGIGASHQTGWSGVVAQIIQTFADTDAQTFLHRNQTSDRPIFADGRLGSAAGDNAIRRPPAQTS